MRESRVLTLFLCLFVVTVSVAAQRGHRNPPTVFTDETKLPAAYGQKDPKLMLQQANDLKQLSENIPGDIQNVNKGIISKDLAERLKKIEKLAKKLREELQY